ncbi:WYL domain-containing protein [Halomonas sp. TBZ9]|uniref:WYL domain-containing protein n=1 Tax=Vreelandella azerica TaxID=2732867 RepID=A0A7Y3XAJ5_9GAMM|nr:WYL domain-containing protein [Halomonas azerica]NOG31260.1 WYL domain-containing protein [Halomonas azerica]
MSAYASNLSKIAFQKIECLILLLRPLAGHCLEFDYQSRSEAGDSQRRCAHPQRLLHYRSNWYLLALCERAKALRLFSLDRMINIETTMDPCHRLNATELDEFSLAGFGIFGGKPKDVAHLLFLNMPLGG